MSRKPISGNENESSINVHLATLLNKRHGWKAMAERTGRIEGESRMRPDIIIETHGASVIIETEYSPAASLEPKDVKSRIGKHIRGLGLPSAIIGIVIPSELKQYSGKELIDMISNKITFEYFVQYSNGNRFPITGNLKGSFSDIRAAITLTSIPWDKIKQCVEMMSNKIDQISYMLEKTDKKVQENICKQVRQGPTIQTWNMAGLVILNAGIFYEELASHIDDFVPLSQLTVVGELPQQSVISAWRKVLDINYAPIFSSAIEIIRALPAGTAGEILGLMLNTVSNIMALKVSKSGDVYGSLYQNMLGDREKLAAYYTRPIAAALLTGLVLPTGNDDLWRDKEKIKKLKIADFACGTGMLLTHAYHHIIHCLNHNITDLHKHMIERCFYGYDILPTATHLTVSNLAGLVPSQIFELSNIFTMPIGKMTQEKSKEGGYYLGSLDLIKDTKKFVTAGVQHGGKGSKEVEIATVKHRTCDYILMNPPYTRATNHSGGRDAPVPPFAIFGIGPKEQLEMADHNNKLYKNTCAHGNAGLASYFMAICEKKIKLGGGVGLILPNTISTGASWKKMRVLLSDWYKNITLVSVGMKFNKNSSSTSLPTYSSDTSMAEVMLTAQRRSTKRSNSELPRVKMILLDKFPQSRLEAIEIAKQIRKTIPIQLENGMGHTSLKIGNDIIGKMLNCPIEDDNWWVGRVLDIQLLQFVYNFTHNLIDSIPIIQLEQIANIGKHHLDIIGKKDDGTPRGPFNKIHYQQNSQYSCLWNNSSSSQITMIVSPDSSLEVKHDATSIHVEETWAKATHIHINYQVGYASQRLIAAYTEEVTIGGRTWPNVILDKKYEKAFMVWCNSIFGILTYWIIAGSQQLGRGMMSRIAFKQFPILDFTRLSKTQLQQFDEIFDKLSNMEMGSVNLTHGRHETSPGHNF